MDIHAAREKSVFFSVTTDAVLIHKHTQIVHTLME